MLLGNVDLVYTPIINFAMQQNHVPIIRKLSAKNISGKDLENITIKISSDLDFAIPWEHKIDMLTKDEIIELESIHLKVSPKYLVDLTERISGNIILEISIESETIYVQQYLIDLLAYDQWNGINILPELLSTFVTPNHPQLPKIIKRASEILQGWTGSPSFDEYQSQSPDRIKKQMAAIYEAIAEMKIVYCSVPASFEETGQRIRMCDTIFSTQMGNCLDLTLLYTACLEAVGVHPLIMIVKGHAFAGAWLINESFADPINDDPSLITKRIAPGINEIILVECTCMNAGKYNSFDDSSTSASYKMLKEEEFILFIDIKRSRFSGIRPLPLRLKTNEGWQIIAEQPDIRNSELPEEILPGAKLIDVEKINVSKQKLWERKLLDLTLRNSLLNLRITKNTIQFIGINLAKLEDALAANVELQVLSRPTDWDNPLRNAGIYQSINQSDPILDLVKNEFTQKRLRAYLPEGELVNSMISLYRSSRLSIEENGANTLYIALGLLKWYETTVSEKPRYAPLLLIPVEIVKKSVQKGFVIRSREEETMMNITLLEMLRQDHGINIGGLENLPKDDSGVDVKSVFTIIRQAVMSKKGWDVEEQSFLATFSFSKFILWNDIHNNSDNLLKNKLVKSLVSGKLEWNPADAIDYNLDQDIHPASISLPISSDSSQLHAVITSAGNESFVLHGPPGTGKSQTITNIIANALYQGKKVLFVSAKKAALDVVHSRLHSIGIGAFCLELHSNKTKKTAVLEQLKIVTETSRNAMLGNYQSEADRLFKLRCELNEYVNILHQKTSFDLSLSELINRYCELKPSTNSVFFSASDIRGITTEKLASWDDKTEELQVVATICNSVFNHPLQSIQASQYTQQLKLESLQMLTEYEHQLDEIGKQISKVTSSLKYEIDIKTKQQTDILKNICVLLCSLPDSPASLFGIERAEQNLSHIIGLAGHGEKRNELRDSLLQQFSTDIFSIPAESLLMQWNIAQNKWFIPRLLNQSAIVKTLKKLSQTGSIDKNLVPQILNTVITYKTEQSELDKATDLPKQLQFLWKNGDCNWKDLINICNHIININRELHKLSDPISAARWRNNLSEYFGEGSSAYIQQQKVILNNYCNSIQDVHRTEKKLEEVLQIDFKKLPNIETDWIETSKKYTQQWLENIDLLKDWMNWNRLKVIAIHDGLIPLINACENNDIPATDIFTAYKRGLYKSCINNIIDNNVTLSSFNGKLFDEKIRKFKEISNLFERLTKEELYAKLASNIPDFTKEAAQSSEIGILQKAIKNNGRAMSIRKLFDLVPNLLPRLAPCMLMSPISVAQYFDTADEKFDLLVFDEASQLPTCEAVGAIARAKNVIVVGDPKQMPPTNFFATNNIDEENIEKEDLESILDDCLALSMPSQHLLWHYRSKHESLIAFSNAKYYDNHLLTFPSTDDILSKVTYVHVDGIYETKGRNKAEAEMIVEEILRRLNDPSLSKQSIGVVTFNMVQQNLIEDLLNDVFKVRPDLEKAATDRDEPLFIKNLENVQGDERDVILFSITYGRNDQGKLNMQFGPLNRDGGWRRLNVAVSRARYEMKVFSIMGSTDIDLRRTDKKGVADLKDFLAYAEKGTTALANKASAGRGKDVSFSIMLANEIQKHGYSVHTNIGCSTYKIDVGIINPSNNNEYLLGILCDGDNYFNAKTTRDREITQPQVLKSFGWNILKVWSADWWENPDKSIFEIIKAIKEIQENGSVKEVVAESASQIEPESFLQQAPYQPLTNIYNDSKNVYDTCVLEIILNNSSEQFLFNSNKKIILDQITRVLHIESPVSKDLLCKRVLSAWGIARNGARINGYFDFLFSELRINQLNHENRIFLWKAGQHPLDSNFYRVPKNDIEKRDADDLPPEEIVNVVRKVLVEQISLSRADLIRETAKLFGFSKVGNNVEAAMNLGINLALKSGIAKDQNGRIAVS
ncbi:MAG: DUF3320 domain-containing protein [Bacteroidota bacterium]